MEPITEGVEISIKESTNDSVKEEYFTLGTGDSGEAEYMTNKINGILRAFIITTNKPVDIQVSLYPFDLSVWSELQFNGTRYIPIRNPVYSSKNEVFNFVASDWYLNDPISVKIRGQKFTQVECILRWQ
jgi:hypothetical protein